MVKEGDTIEEARSKIYMMDSRGLVVTSRKDLTEHKLHFAKVRLTGRNRKAEVYKE